MNLILERKSEQLNKYIDDNFDELLKEAQSIAPSLADLNELEIDSIKDVVYTLMYRKVKAI